MSDAETGAATTLTVVVSPGVSPYLQRTLLGLAEQTRPVGTVLVVDTSAAGREVGTGVPVHAAVDAAGLREVSAVRVLHLPAPRTFGAAVRAALAEDAAHRAEQARRQERPATPDEPWLWLLHDDSAPEPRAHAELLRAGESGPSIALAGPKQRDWARPDLLLEAGVRATATGRRVPDIEDGEIDQGQHDDREDVLAVGTAGVLVRRAVWDELGGPDPSLGPFGDGLDLSQRAWLAGHRVVVVPGAVVHHAQASYQGLRDLSSPKPDPQVAPDPRRSFAARRRSQLFLWLTTTPWYWVPLVVLAILALAPLRALWRVTTKEIGLVGAEMRAAAEVLAAPAAVWRARRRHRRSRTVPLRYLRPLRSSWRAVAQAKRDERRSQAAVRDHREAPSELEIRERAVLARRRRGTLALLLLGLTTIALLAFGPLLTAGALQGGALAALDATARELWGAATSAWVAAGLGHAGPADPLLTVLALAALPLAPLGGGGGVLTTAVLVLAVPLAGLGAWFAAGAATRSVLLRAWAAALWALSPVLLIGVGQGRLGAVLAHVVLPWVALGLARAVGVQRRDVILSGLADAHRGEVEEVTDDQAAVELPAATVPIRPASGSIAAAAGAGLALAVVCAGAPVLLPAAVLVLLALALVVPRRRALLLLVAVPPALLLGPLFTAALTDLPGGGWRALLAAPGAATGVDPGASWLAVLGWPLALPELTALEGPWPTVLALAGGAALALTAVLALLRGTGRVRAVRAGWFVVVVGLAVALLAGRTEVAVGTDLTGQTQVVHGWAGPGVSLALLGMLVAVTAGGDGLRQWLTARSFGWRQLSAGLVTTAMVLGPLATTGAWLATVVTGRGEDPVLLAVEGRPAPPVPALARELQDGPERARVLALHADGEAVRPEVWRRPGPQLTETTTAVAVRGLTAVGDPAEPDQAGGELVDLVAQLATGTAPEAGEQLGRLAVGVVLVPPTQQPGSVATRQDLVARLDATAGLERVTENDSGVIWRTSQSAGQPGAAQSVARVRLVEADGTAQSLPADVVSVDTHVPAGSQGRRVVLAERADTGWRATYNGHPLRASTEGWRQAFEVPAHTGRLEIGYEQTWSLPWRLAQAVGLGLTVLLAVPVRRRREETP